MSKGTKKLLLVGSTQSGIHIKNYYNLIKDYFDEVLIVSGNKVDYCNSVELNFGIRNPISVFKNIGKLKKIIQDYKPNIIHVHQANSFGYITSMANKSKIPQVLTAWGSDVLLLPQQNSFFKYIVKKSLTSSNRITVDARFMGEKVKQLNPQANVTVANFGISFDDEKIDVEGKENIVYSNRLHNELYNIDKIIKAFESFQKTYPDWKLVLAATGDKTDELKKIAAELLPLASYEFIGFVDAETNKAYYLRSKLFVSIPSSDGTAISLLEAMAYGTIPVVSDLPANREWITNGENGVIVNKTLCEGLIEALQLDLTKVAGLNREIIRERATKTANKRIFEEIYSDLIID